MTDKHYAHARFFAPFASQRVRRRWSPAAADLPEAAVTSCNKNIGNLWIQRLYCVFVYIAQRISTRAFLNALVHDGRQYGNIRLWGQPATGPEGQHLLQIFTADLREDKPVFVW
ncbi:hypothetical protein CBL_01870 [Carabus blaptoides fortunei]